MHKIVLFNKQFELSQVLILLFIIISAIILIIVLIRLLICLKKYRMYIREINKCSKDLNLEDDEDENNDDENKDNEEELSINSQDGENKITCPRRLNLTLRLNNSSEQLKARYSTIRNFLSCYKINERFLKHRDLYFIRKETIEHDENGSIVNKSNAYKLAMMTIRRKQLILSLNPQFELTLEETNKNIKIETRRYEAFNYNMKISSKKDVDDAISLLRRILDYNNVLSKKNNKYVDYVKRFSDDLSSFERKGYGYLVRKEINLEEADKYVDSLATKALVIKKIDSKPVKDKMVEISLDVLAKNFEDNSTINLDILKEKHLASDEYTKLYVSNGNYLNKKLFVDADGYSSNAIKMIFLVGGEARIIKREENI